MKERYALLDSMRENLPVQHGHILQRVWPDGNLWTAYNLFRDMSMNGGVHIT